MADGSLVNDKKPPKGFVLMVQEYHKKESATAFWSFLAKQQSDVANIIVKMKDHADIEKTITNSN